MTLHETSETLKKTGIGTMFGIGAIVILIIFFQIGVMLKNIFFPPKIDPPNLLYSKLEPIQFPPSVETGELTYYPNTETGEMPDFPDRLQVFPIIHRDPGLNDLEATKVKALTMGFASQQGVAVPEIKIDNNTYQWTNPSATIQKTVTFNIISSDFSLTSNYAQIEAVLSARHLSNQEAAIGTVQEALVELGLFYNDLDIEKTQKPDAEKAYLTSPQIFSIDSVTEQLKPATGLNSAQVIRVDLYQKDIEYDLYAKHSSADRLMKTETMKFPIIYPQPPHSTMNFLIASNDSAQDIVEADFTHQEVDRAPEKVATYPIKTAQQAYDELTAAKAYIARADNIGADRQIKINKVYLAYYLGKEPQEYLLPVVVFEGDSFFAFISAIADTPTEEVQP